MTWWQEAHSRASSGSLTPEGGLRFLSVCSGIEAVSCALDPLGFTPVGFSEIDRAASRVLVHHFGSNMPGEPLSRNGVPNYGDFTQIPLETLGAVDWLMGGTPCQAFSVAGKRMSLADARGNLTLSYVVLAHELARSHGLRGCLWENVPGVLNTADNAFGCFLGALVGHDTAFPQPRGAGWPSSGMADGPRGRCAWRVLDAQYFGLAQRRKRVFVVGSFDERTDPAAILFESEGLRGNSTPRRQARQGATGTLSARTEGCGGLGNDFDLDGGLIAARPLARCVTAGEGTRQDFETTTMIACELVDTLSVGANQTSGFVGDFVAQAFNWQSGGDCRGLDLSDLVQPLTKEQTPAVCEPYTLAIRGRGDSHDLEYRQDGTANALILPNGGRGGIGVGAIATQWAVRRLTPTECERLQGFPDNWTAIPDSNGKVQADGPRYKQLGNSMAVPCIAWIGRAILADAAHNEEAA